MPEHGIASQKQISGNFGAWFGEVVACRFRARASDRLGSRLGIPDEAVEGCQRSKVFRIVPGDSRSVRHAVAHFYHVIPRASSARWMASTLINSSDSSAENEVPYSASSSRSRVMWPSESHSSRF